MKKLEKKLNSLLKECVNPKYLKKGIKPEMNLQKDLGMDSMAMAVMAYRIEEVFNIDFKILVARAARIRVVGDVLQLLEDEATG